jgi:PEP-CTERM motif
MNKHLRTVFSCAATLMLAGAAHAAPIVLFNTGVDAVGAVLPGNSVGDAHYSLVATPVGSTGTLRVVSAAGGYPVGPWLGDNTLSRWIGPGNDDDVNGPAGAYTYRTTFDLAGLDPASAVIAGAWATDNNGLDILINGISLGYTTASNQFQLGFAAFSVTSGFRAGINTLDFRVANDGGPAGLRVQMAGSADLGSEVPEPASLALTGVALLGLAATRRRA